MKPDDRFRAVSERKHQHAEIRACLLGRHAADGVFAEALCHYLKQNEAYSVQELYERVGTRVMQKTYNPQMCELTCESTELSHRFDLFLTPAKWAEHCSALEELKPEMNNPNEGNPNESAFLSENLELREEAQRLQEEAEQMEQMQASLVESGYRVASGSHDSFPRRWLLVFAQLCCLCWIFWTLRMLLWPTAAADAVQICEEELRKAHSSQFLLLSGMDFWFVELYLQSCMLGIYM